MSASDEHLMQRTLRAFREREVEAGWERLDAPDEARYLTLWRALHEIGLAALGLTEEAGGIGLDARSRFQVLHDLGAAAPALACGLVSHATAFALLCEAGEGRLPGRLEGLASETRFALIGSPLDGMPDTGFALAGDGSARLSGAQRAMLAYPEWLAVPARGEGRLHLCLVRADEPGVRFAPIVSSHGLRFLPFGELAFDGAALAPDCVFPWPGSGRAANEADGLVTALLAGMAGEVCERAMQYALTRWQGGKMIHEHDAIQQLVGPIAVARRPLEALALATLGEARAGDGGAAAFAAGIVRQSALDAIQTLGGYGYMEDYRLERYLRDANTLETFWIHASARERDVARRRLAEMSR